MDMTFIPIPTFSHDEREIKISKEFPACLKRFLFFPFSTLEIEQGKRENIYFLSYVTMGINSN